MFLITLRRCRYSDNLDRWLKLIGVSECFFGADPHNYFTVVDTASEGVAAPPEAERGHDCLWMMHSAGLTSPGFGRVSTAQLATSQGRLLRDACRRYQGVAKTSEADAAEIAFLNQRSSVAGS